MLGQLIKLLKILNGDIAPGQIAAGFAFGVMLGFTPLWSLHNLLVLFFICIFRINITAVLMAWAVAALFSFGLDSSFIALGEAILTKPEWQALWTQWYQNDLLRLAHFNNTLTMGSMAVSLLLWLPVYLLSRFIIVKYRVHIMIYLKKLRVMQWLKGSRFSKMIIEAMEG